MQGAIILLRNLILELFQHEAEILINGRRFAVHSLFQIDFAVEANDCAAAVRRQVAFTEGADAVDHHAAVVVTAGDDGVRSGRDDVTVFRSFSKLPDLRGIGIIVHHGDPVAIVRRAGQVTTFLTGQLGNILEACIFKADHRTGQIMERSIAHIDQLDMGLDTGSADAGIGLDFDLDMLARRHININIACRIGSYVPSDFHRSVRRFQHGVGRGLDVALQPIPIHEFVVDDGRAESIVVGILFRGNVAAAAILLDGFVIHHGIAAADIEIVMLTVGALAAAQPVGVPFDDPSAHGRGDDGQVAAAKVIDVLGNQVAANEQGADGVLVEHKVAVMPGGGISVEARRMRTLRVRRANGDGAVLGQQGFQGIILHTVIIPMERDHIVHIGQVDLRFILRLSFVQIVHDAVRHLAGDGIMHHLIPVGVLFFLYRPDGGIRRIGHAVGHINDFDLDIVLAASEHLAAHLMLIGVGDGHVDQRVSFFIMDIVGRRIADLHQAVRRIAALVADSDADVHLIADSILGEVFLVDFQPHEVIDVIGALQADGILIAAVDAFDKGHPVRRIVVHIAGIRRFFPGEVILVVQPHQTDGPAPGAFRIHFHPAVFGAETDLLGIVAQGILGQAHIAGDGHSGLRTGPGNGHQRPALHFRLIRIPDPGAQIVSAAEGRIGRSQVLAGDIVSIDIHQISVFAGGGHDN